MYPLHRRIAEATGVRGTDGASQPTRDEQRASYLIVSHALGLGYQLRAAHSAVTFSEQLLVNVRRFHLFTATKRRDNKQI